MKKIYSLFSLALIGSMASSITADAQITLSSADMPMIGTKAVNCHDTVHSSTSKLTPGNSGASAVWNYASLPVTYRDTDAFVNPTSTPYSSSFPTANLADSTYGTAGYIFLDGTSSSFAGVGTVQNVQGVNAIVVLKQPFVQITFPAAYGDVNSGVSTANTAPVAVTNPIADSVKGSVYIGYKDTIDAWGTLTTPLFGGTSYSVLRQKHYELDIDTLFIQTKGSTNWQPFNVQVTKVYQYRWYAQGVGDVVAVMAMDSTNKKVASMQWYSGYPDGINELSQQHNTLAYPNPCTNQITFHYNLQNASNIFVYDIAGRQIGNATMKNGAVVLNTTGYSAGMYFYHITDITGNVLDNGKFTVTQ